MRPLVLGVALVPAVVVVMVTLIASNAVRRYELWSYRRHAVTIRRLLPRRAARLLAPCLPLTALAGQWATDVATASPTAIGHAIRVAWLIVALAAAEVYSVCLHREAWIAAFEPWFIPTDARPLGGRPIHPEDRRLQHLFRIQLEYASPLVITSLMLPSTGTGWLGSVLLGALTAKFVGHAAGDYEVVTHWDMHCHVLSVEQRPRVTRCVEDLAGWYLGPLFGYVPEIYPCEHLLIHHPSNAGPRDAHTPLPFLRTSFLEFCAFALCALPRYLVAHRVATDPRVDFGTRRRVRAGVAVHWSVVALLLVTDGRLLGLWLCAASVHRAVTATRSQYVWHGLLDVTRPQHPVAGTILWVPGRGGSRSLLSPPGSNTVDRPPAVPTPGTDWGFYDNLHLVHHLRPRAHYATYPDLLRDPTVRRAVADAVALDLAALPTFAQDCWTDRIDRISRHVLTPAGVDAETLLRRRLEPLEAMRSPFAVVTMHRVGRAADRVAGRALYALTGGR
jgi:hypothetical protein